MKIEDGKGSGRLAGVNKLHRISVDSVSRRRLSDLAEREKTAFIISSGYIALTTTASFSGMLYIKNDDPEKLLCFDSARCGGTQDAKWRFIKNPLNGTLITSGTDIEPVNLNFGASRKLIGVFKQGSDAQTITDGIEMDNVRVSGSDLPLNFDGALILTPGDTLAMLCQPDAAGDFHISTLAFLAEDPTKES